MPEQLPNLQLSPAEDGAGGAARRPGVGGGAAAALDLVGGAVSLLAAARRRADGVRDYVMFVQERSGTVLNLAGKLAVVPKGFHQPTGEPANEAQLSVTIRREM